MHLVVHADQRQFSLRDKAARLTGAGWTDSALAARVASEPRALAVVTARSDLVEAAVTVSDSTPAPAAEASHVVEVDLEVPSGVLVVSGPADYPSQERSFPVAPGLYRARVSYVPSGPPPAEWNDFEFGEHYRYLIDLWPSPAPAGVAVLLQGPDVWDG